VRAAFGQRRKTIRNSLAAFAAERGLDADGLRIVFRRADIDPASGPSDSRQPISPASPAHSRG
jgi:16S rRNA A1518/A1519 N6-dimethyltransferase RsmA/KsgA/DIM1 with predicted DNA glycosylase/AP lyase activity